MNKILAFDGDGVIFDGTMGILAQVFGESFQTFGIPKEEGVAYMYATTGTPTAIQYRNFLKDRELLPRDYNEANGLIDRLVRDFTNNAYKEMPSLCADVLPVLPYLKGNKLAISTNAPQEVLDRRVGHHGLGEWFSYWFGKTEGTPDKRQHKPLIIKSFGLSEDYFRQNAMLIGDGYTDMSIAREWDIKGVGRKTEDNTEEGLKEAGAIIVIRSLGELPDLVESLF